MLPFRLQEYKKNAIDIYSIQSSEDIDLQHQRKVSIKTNTVPDKTRNGFKWTESELEQLIHQAHEMKSLQEIAEIHQRSISSIRYKLLQYAVRMLYSKVHIDSIVKILPLKKKEIIDYYNNLKKDIIESDTHAHMNGNSKEYTTSIIDSFTNQFNGKYIPYEREKLFYLISMVLYVIVQKITKRNLY
jgi:hypothetical protein